ncbi:14101_t:CDS:2, partial [Funneliformis geosporum]
MLFILYWNVVAREKTLAIESSNIQLRYYWITRKALGESIKMYFEGKIQRYKPKRDISEVVAKTLKNFNV